MLLPLQVVSSPFTQKKDRFALEPVFFMPDTPFLIVETFFVLYNNKLVGTVFLEFLEIRGEVIFVVLNFEFQSYPLFS